MYAQAVAPLPLLCLAVDVPPRDLLTMRSVLGVKGIITDEGVWRISKQGKSDCIQVFKLEDSGHGNVLSSDFVQWRHSTSPSDVRNM